MPPVTMLGGFAQRRAGRGQQVANARLGDAENLPHVSVPAHLGGDEHNLLRWLWQLLEFGHRLSKVLAESDSNSGIGICLFAILRRARHWRFAVAERGQSPGLALRGAE
jgi:hypothetical protein